jgi:hypothetical protein
MTIDAILDGLNKEDYETEDMMLVRQFAHLYDVAYRPSEVYDEDGQKLYFFNDGLGGYTPVGLVRSIAEKFSKFDLKQMDAFIRAHEDFYLPVEITNKDMEGWPNEEDINMFEKVDREAIDLFSTLTGLDYVGRRPCLHPTEFGFFENAYIFSNGSSYTRESLERVLPDDEDIAPIRNFMELFHVSYLPSAPLSRDGKRLYQFNDSHTKLTPEGVRRSLEIRFNMMTPEEYQNYTDRHEVF